MTLRLSSLILLLTLIGAHYTQAQKQYNPSNDYDPELSNRLLIRTTPTSLLGRYGKRLPVGLEYCFWKDGAFIFEAGIPFDQVIPQQRGNHYEKDLALRSELRVYFGYTRHSKWYIGLEGFRRSLVFNQVGGNYFIDDLYNNYTYRSADIDRQVYGGALKTGFCIHTFGNVFTELFIGTGFKNVKNKRDNIIGLDGPKKTYKTFVTAHSEDDLYEQGTMPYFTLGVTISYLTGKRIFNY